MRHNENFVDFEKWSWCIYMVIYWIIDSMTQELFESLVYSQSTKELWDNITKRFGQSTEPLMFQLQYEVTNIKQGNLSVSIYHNRFKKCWDEI